MKKDLVDYNKDQSPSSINDEDDYDEEREKLNTTSEFAEYE